MIDPDPPVRLRDVWSALAASRWVIAAVTACAIALAAILTHLATPVYESEVTLRLKEDAKTSSPLGDIADVAGVSLGGADDGIETELDVLRSRQIAEAVTDSLALQIRLDAPLAPRDSVLRVLSGARSAPVGEYTFARIEGDRYRVTATELKDPVQLPAEVRVGQPFRLGATELALAPALGGDPPEEVRVSVVSFADAVDQLRDEMTVDRPNTRSRVLVVRYQTADRLLAAAVPNAAASSFLEYSTGTSKAELRSTVAVLRSQVELYRQRFEEAEERLSRFQADQPLADLSRGASRDLSRLAEIQAQRDMLDLQRQSLAKLVRQIQAEQGGGTQTQAYRQLAAFPPFISNPAVQEILITLLKLDGERTALLQRRNPTNDDVQTLTHRIRDLELQLYSLAQNYLSSLESQIRSADQALAGFDQRLGTVPSRAVDLRRLESEVAFMGGIYSDLQKQLKQAEIQADIERGDVRILDAALVPDRPVSPRPVVNLALGAVLGLMVGVVVALGRRALDPRVRTRTEVEELTGGVPVLGTIPAPAARRVAPSMASVRRIRLPGIATSAGNHRPALAGTATIESFRALSTRIAQAELGGVPRVIVVTSPSLSNGRAITARHLAVAFAERGMRTVLVDADLRQRELQQLLRLPDGPGFADLLAGEGVEALLQATSIGPSRAPLAVLPAGSRAADVAELLRPRELHAALQQLREHFEVVILAAPALNVVSDASLLATASDAAILVAQAGATVKDDLRDAAEELRHLGVHLLGVVLHEGQVALEVGAATAMAHVE